MFHDGLYRVLIVYRSLKILREEAFITSRIKKQVYRIPIKIDQEKEAKKARMLASFVRMGYTRAEIARKLNLKMSDVDWYLEEYLK